MDQEQRRIADLEARNALLQFDEVQQLFLAWQGELRLTLPVVCSLQQLGVRDLDDDAGKFRTESVVITNSKHQPPSSDEIPALIVEMCEYANSHQQEALHTSSYLMWRLNWIHPFVDGNGRTSRALSYLALCCSLKMELPGQLTVPELIIRNKPAYYIAIEAADAAWARGTLDVSVMEFLIGELLKQQLSSG